MTVVDACRDAENLSALRATRPWLSCKLDAADRDALSRACSTVWKIRAGTHLVRPGADANALHILLDGWAARYKIMEEGGGFISSLSVPGDICDLDALRVDKLDYGVTMLSAGTVALLPRNRVGALFGANPGIAEAFWSLALTENAILTEWAASIGRRSASQRLAHLLCELLARITVIGKADGHSYDLPLTQQQLADVLGLTTVHTNRMLQLLRTMNLVTMRHRRVTIHDWAALSAMGGFRSNYLHLETVEDRFAIELPL